jgi:hypothetical protein
VGIRITTGCFMVDMVFVLSSWKEQDMTKVDKACLSKPGAERVSDCWSERAHRARARKHTDFLRRQPSALPQEWCPAPAPSAIHSVFSAYGLRQLSWVLTILRTA